MTADPDDWLSALGSVVTPALVIDLPTVRRNVERMAGKAADAGVVLRPHAKTHKSGELARLQVAAGAIGVTCARLSEAEVFASAGVEDILVCYPIVGRENLGRLRRLRERANVRVTIDSIPVAEALSAEFGGGEPLEVLLEIDAGLGRLGWTLEQLPEVANALGRLGGLRPVGVLAFAGQAYRTRDDAELSAVARQEGDRAVRAAEMLTSSGLDTRVVSVGSTPTAREVMRVPGVTEIRPGSYVFNDRNQVLLGSATLADCAALILATVIAVPGQGRAVVDAGSKSLAMDPAVRGAAGHGIVVGHPDVRVAWLMEEHGMLEWGAGTEPGLRVGARVAIVPNHICNVVNLFDEYVVVDDPDRIERWSVDARGARGVGAVVASS